jgi:hypothetical protein
VASSGQDEPPPEAAGPAAEYRRRRHDRGVVAARLARLERLVGNGRLAVFLAGAILAWYVFGARTLALGWLALPLAAFIALVIWHDRVNQRRSRARRAEAFYERGLARLEHRWQGSGEPGTRFLDETHPSAQDLDLFGPGSLFELLCQVRTRDGEDTLANWLRAPAAPEEVRARQAAVAELRPRLDLREDLDLVGAKVRAVVNPEGLAAWGTAPPVLPGRWARVTTFILAVLGVAALAGWYFLDIGSTPFLAVAILEVTFTTWLRPRVQRVVAGIDRKAQDLALLATVLARLEREPVVSPRLRFLRSQLDSAGQPPSARIDQLGRIVDRLNWRGNQLFAPFAILLLWTTQHALALEAWRLVSGPAIARWLAAVGEFEALCALAGYAYENPDDPFPELVTPGPRFEGEGLGHPLIPPARCIRNDLQLGGECRLLVVSGSNMSGKSTLLRTVGVNTVLALAGAPVRARQLRLSPLVVGATLRIQDSLQAGRSRFYAEITRVRQLVDLARGSPPLLFLLDELFQGTNSHDRRLGAEAVVRHLVELGAIGLVTTHDLALTHIADRLGPRGANVHFEDHFEDGAMTFDYRMRPGVVRKSNALALMRAVGLNVPAEGSADGEGASGS